MAPNPFLLQAAQLSALAATWRCDPRTLRKAFEAVVRIARNWHCQPDEILGAVALRLGRRLASRDESTRPQDLVRYARRQARKCCSRHYNARKRYAQVLQHLQVSKGRDDAAWPRLVRNCTKRMEDREMLMHLDRALSSLPELDSLALRTVFALPGGDVSVRQLADRFGLSRARIYQLKDQAILKLRAWFYSRGLN